MKKIVAIAVSVLLLLSSLTLCVAAERSITAAYQNGELTLSWGVAYSTYSLKEIVLNGKSYTSFEQQSNGATLAVLLTENVTATCTFEGEDRSTLTSPPFSVEVDLSVTAVYDSKTKQLKGSWSGSSYTASDLVTAVKVAGVEYPVTKDGNTFTADLSSITEPKEYSVSYLLSVGGVTGELKGISFKVEDDVWEETRLVAEKKADGEYVATLTDELGFPLVNVPVKFYKDGVLIDTVVTTQLGTATFVQTILPEEESLLLFVFEGGEYNLGAYKESSARLEHGNSTTVPSSTTVTTTTGELTTYTVSTTYTPLDTSATTTKTTTRRWTTSSTKRKTTATTTTKLGWGATTTGRYDTEVVANAVYDMALLKTFGVKESLFNEQVRVLMEPERYQALANEHGAALMLSVFPTEDSLPESLLQYALENSEEYGFYQPEDAKSFALSLSIAAVKSNEEYTVLNPTMVPKDIYTVYLPVPNSFKNCDLAILSLEQETPKFIEVVANNGMFSFEVEQFGSYAVVAFPSATRTLAVPPVAIVMFVMAGLCLAGAGVVLYFFVIRVSKPVAVAAERDGAELLSFDDDSEEEED